MTRKCLQGDLNQLYVQSDFLKNKNIKVVFDQGIPVVDKADYEQAVRIIYEFSVSGWWNYKKDLISFGICTKDEFTEKLRR